MILTINDKNMKHSAGCYIVKIGKNSFSSYLNNKASSEVYFRPVILIAQHKYFVTLNLLHIPKITVFHEEGLKPDFACTVDIGL